MGPVVRKSTELPVWRHQSGIWANLGKVLKWLIVPKTLEEYMTGNLYVKLDGESTKCGPTGWKWEQNALIPNYG